MSRINEVYIPALKGKKIPILTLDNKWHQIVSKREKNSDVDRIMKELNELLKQQGRVNTKVKEIKNLKKKLMEGIVTTVDELDNSVHQAKKEKKLEESKRLIEECNEKLAEYEDKQLDLPRLIEEKNLELMLATMEFCYTNIAENTEEIAVIDEWVSKVRVELKKNLIRKQEKEYRNREMYSYMHDIFGPDVIDIFDLKYNPEDAALKPPGSVQNNKEKEQ